MDAGRSTEDLGRRLPIALIALGLFVSVRGYRSFDGDQAYRLPLLLRMQDGSLYAGDPFVRAFDAFNPHAGYLRLLDAASRPLGLPAGLFALFAGTFVLTVLSVERLGRAVWPGSGSRVGWLAAGMVLATQAGNIGTNHLFEPTLLDRLVALGLGWAGIGMAVGGLRGGLMGAAGLLGVAAWVHPSMGLQLALGLGALLGAGLAAPGLGWSRRTCLGGMVAIGLGQAPSLVRLAGQGGALTAGLPEEEFRQLALFVQGPQHLVPHLWRRGQWLAWGCFPLLAGVALAGSRGLKGCGVRAGGQVCDPASLAGEPNHGAAPAFARRRVGALIGLLAVGLAVAGGVIEAGVELRLALFQPFRMATVVRGLCLIVLAGRVVGHIRGGTRSGWMRAACLGVGLTGDWAMVVATGVELAGTVGERLGSGRLRDLLVAAALVVGVAFLARHDTQGRHVGLAAGVGGAAIAYGIFRGRGWDEAAWSRGRWVRVGLACWSIPVAAGLAGWSGGSWGAALVEHCRFGETPADELERLAWWCRQNTPPGARFVGPPGAKTFRLWSRRELAFNRAAGPYHAAGLADWAGRFKEHVGFAGTTEAFARAYLADHKGLERRYDAMSDGERAELARRQGAGYVVARAGGGGRLTELHREGRWAVYEVRADRDAGLAARPVRGEGRGR